MAEVSYPSELKRALESNKWAGPGIRGFLIGQQGLQGQLSVLNVWLSQGSSSSNLVDNKDSCLCHLPAALDIVGIIVVTQSTKQGEVHSLLQSLPLEIQTAISGPLFAVCVVSNVPASPAVSFYSLSLAEDKQTQRLRETPDKFEANANRLIFRVQARLSLQLQLDNSRPANSEKWEDKIRKAFWNLESEVTSGWYVYGIKGADIYLSEDSVTGVNGKVTSVKELHKCIVEAEHIETRRRKILTSEQSPPVLVELYQQVSGNTGRFAQPTCAPAVHQRYGSFRCMTVSLPVDVLVEIEDSKPVSTLMTRITTGITHQLHAMRQCMEQHHNKENEFYTPEPFHFSIPHRHTCVTVVYPRNVPDTEIETRRRQLHEKMCLGLDRPLFRRANVMQLDGQTAQGGYIIRPHVGLPPSGVKGGTPHLVYGNYTYHHYMQDRFDDDKWGCAYRSLQTLVSWFRFQGYTQVPVPSHKEIQQALVAVGDKENNFVGSKKWIGSFEVSFVLDHLLGVTSKFLSVSEGADLASKGRELAQHFDTQGTPIMIGGGVLAHTILGVDYSEVTGDIKFLILDPHYTGGEDLPTIHREGWCGWKDIKFWNPTAHYNLCMPQRPVCF